MNWDDHEEQTFELSDAMWPTVVDAQLGVGAEDGLPALAVHLKSEDGREVLLAFNEASINEMHQMFRGAVTIIDTNRRRN